MNPESNRSVFPNCTTNSYNHHDIFLSHSGAQKGFAKDLYRVLTSHGFSTFFDITLHSLPLAEPFPQRILDAASSCKLALVVLSHDYLSCKWPMSELCAFARATRSSVKIFPLFLHLVPEDLKNDQNLERWRMQWSSFAESDPRRINVKEWEEAVALLRPQNGLVRDMRAEGELGFIERIVSSILVSSPSLAVTPRNRYDTSYVQGEARLRQIILDKFHEMESSCHHERYVDRSTDDISCVLGIHGIPGSGKSTLCKGLANYFFQLYSGRSLHVELPTNPTSSTLLYALKDFLSLITLHIGTEHVTHIDQVLVKEMLLPCVLNSFPYDQHNCIDFEKLSDHAYMFGIERWGYVDAEKMGRLLEHSNAEFVRGKPKEALFQQLNVLTPIFCGMLDACQNQDFADRQGAKTILVNL